MALAIPTDASTQNQVTSTGGLQVRIDGPSEDNGDNGPDGRFFCTLYDGGRCVPLNRSACGGDLRQVEMVLTMESELAANSRMYVFATTSDCTFAENQQPTTTPVLSDELSSSAPLVNGQAFDYPGDFSGGSEYATVQGIADAIGACSDAGIQNQRYRLCIGISVASDGAPDSAIESSEPYLYATFLVDTVVPEAPTEFSVTGGDSRFRLRVALSADNDEVSKYIVRYHVAPDDELEGPPDADCSTWTDAREVEYTPQGTADEASEFTIDDIENGVNFEVCAAARDIAGNLGAFSTVQRARTRDECDFIECYPDEVPTGYCGSVPSSILGLWAAVALFARWRRPSRRLLPFVLLAALALPTAAQAQVADGEVWVTSPPDPYEHTPQFGVELKAGPFRPKIGDYRERQTYALIYTDDNSLFENRPLMKQLEVSWYPFNRYGLGGVFFRFGHWRASGKTRSCATDEDPNAECSSETLASSAEGNEKTSLTVLPLTIGVVYKFDVLKERYFIPLVPYVKGGIDYYLWFNSAAGETSVATDGSKGRGGQLGINGSLGLALNLDWIDPDAATNGRSGGGIADTYIFFEYTQAYSGFRSSGLDMTDNYCSVGLAIDFE